MAGYFFEKNSLLFLNWILTGSGVAEKPGEKD